MQGKAAHRQPRSLGKILCVVGPTWFGLMYIKRAAVLVLRDWLL